MEDLFAANQNTRAEDFWAGLDLNKLPKTSKDASSLGVKFFYTSEECIHGHDSPQVHCWRQVCCMY